ncbi:MAG: YvcK family protein [Clostridiaceae bacterium]|nr:YvcK family protein [Clostridiaceae bacterium]
MYSPKWLKIGLQFRRWLVSGVIGFALMALSLIVLLKDVQIGPFQLTASILLAISGLYFIFECIKRIFVKFVNVYSNNGLLKKPSNVSEIGDILYKRKILASGPKIVAIGGGTGISTMLRGLKEYTSNITAIITVADDGGGSGTLRNDLGILPPGDIRNCLIALAETEPVMEKLLKYRFTEGSLKGQSFGNLFLAAMTGISDSFEQAVKYMGQVLAVTGRVYPVTEENIFLVAELEDGTQIRGESRIGNHHLTHPGKIKRIMLDKPNVAPLPQALKAIEDADLIVLGPGSLYTSIIPNLLVNGIARAIAQSKAPVLYVCNVMTQPGETEGYTVGDHINAIHEHAGSSLVDICLVNNGDIKPSILKKYHEDGAEPVKIDTSRIKRMGIRLVEKDLARISDDFVRHDPIKLARAIIEIYKNR